jgi:hypothetical protein
METYGGVSFVALSTLTTTRLPGQQEIFQEFFIVGTVCVKTASLSTFRKRPSQIDKT